MLSVCKTFCCKFISSKVTKSEDWTDPSESNILSIFEQKFHFIDHIYLYLHGENGGGLPVVYEL